MLLAFLHTILYHSIEYHVSKLERLCDKLFQLEHIFGTVSDNAKLEFCDVFSTSGLKNRDKFVSSNFIKDRLSDETCFA